MNKTISVLMVGVGGQGIVLAGNVLCSAAMYAGYDVKKSEIHGMAQRGGSVVSHVRFGEKVFSPVIPQGGADYLISFERIEYLRYLSYVSQNTTLILNSRRILPPGVAMGTQSYPDEIIEREKSRFATGVEFDADDLALQAGNAKAASSVMLGKLAEFLDISAEAWMKAMQDNIPAKLIEVNDKAFKKGLAHKA
ncbi:MAG: indolepyruvate oxidoreductase subunit beta [Deferribacteraceae bacterium]|jgi:indolepyruvate ferredoxin oxidoreductase beta subunit|nr:indolepyruvate oxidoreductase subunit beta [Deferribacteraceae bacterium]